MGKARDVSVAFAYGWMLLFIASIPKNLKDVANATNPRCIRRTACRNRSPLTYAFIVSRLILCMLSLSCSYSAAMQIKRSRDFNARMNVLIGVMITGFGLGMSMIELLPCDVSRS